MKKINMPRNRRDFEYDMVHAFKAGMVAGYRVEHTNISEDERAAVNDFAERHGLKFIWQKGATMKEAFELIKERLEEESKFAISLLNGKTDRYVAVVCDTNKKAIKIVSEVEAKYNQKFEPTSDLIECGVDGYNLHLKEQYRKGYEDAKA